jgi:hypothetical protein
MKPPSVLTVFLLSLSIASPALHPASETGGDPGPAAETKLIFAMSAPDLAAFERNAKLAKELGATHVVITDNLPPALWQFDPPGDPYPGLVRVPSGPPEGISAEGGPTLRQP